MSVNIDTNLNNETWEFAISGELDVSCADKLKEVIYKKIDEKMLDVVLDFKDLSYIDSTGVGVIVGIMKKLRSNEKDIKIINLKENVMKIFKITGLNKIINMEG